MRFGRRKDKEQEALGVHIARDAVTIARVAKLNGSIQVVQLFHQPLPREPGKWPAELAEEKLAMARRAVNLVAEEAAVTVAGDLAPSHFLSMPALDDDQLADAVKLQIENKWGDSPPQLSWEYAALGKRGERCRVFASSIPLQTLKLILTSFRGVNCKIDVVEVEPVSLANLLHLCRLGNDKPVAALSLGSGCAEIHIVNKRGLALSREITLAENRAPEPVEAGDETGRSGLDAASLQTVTHEVNKTLDYFEIEMLSPPVERLVLVGKAADDRGIQDMMEFELGVRIGPLDTELPISDATNRFQPTLHGLAVAAAVNAGDAS
jgi:Tfp pilus assembly PilM family ATPase